MRYEPDHKARFHRRIVQNASCQLRAKGLNGPLTSRSRYLACALASLYSPVQVQSISDADLSTVLNLPLPVTPR